MFGITKNCSSFFRFCIIFVTVSILQVSALPILFVNMLGFYPSEMASSSTPVNSIPNHEESQKGSMVPISRDGNKRCCSISRP